MLFRSIDDPSLEAPLASGAIRPMDGAEAGRSEQLYQVIGVDQNGDRAWLRRWPLARHGSPVFEISLQQLQERQPHRPLPAGRHEG